MPAAFKLFFQLIIAPDRPLNQLGKKRDEQRKPRQVFLRRIFAVVHIQQIAHRLKRVKTDAQRQQQPKRRRAEPAAHVVRIFERRQQAEIKQKRREHCRALSAPGLRLDRFFPFPVRRIGLGFAVFADLGDNQRGQPRGNRRQQDERQPCKAPRRVKAVARQQQNRPADLGRAEMINRRADKTVGGQHE